MGPIKSFQNNYLENLNKRRKPKREAFGTSTKKTVEGIIPNKKLSQELKNEIIDDSRKEKENLKKRLAIVYTILALILLSAVLSYI